MSIYSQQFTITNHQDANTSLSKILKLIKQSDKYILDVGCSSGYLDSLIKQKIKTNITGIELNKSDAQIAKNIVDQILNVDAETYNFNQLSQKFNVIILADILEHLKNPEYLLKTLSTLLKPNGRIIASIPNFLHYSTKIKILTNRWRYEEYGLLDKTHLKFFSLATIKELFKSSKLFINNIDYVTSNITTKNLLTELINSGLSTHPNILNTVFSPESKIFQYIIVSSKTKTKISKVSPPNNYINLFYATCYSIYYKIRYKLL